MLVSQNVRVRRDRRHLSRLLFLRGEMISFILGYLPYVTNWFKINISIIFQHCFQAFFLLLQLWRWLFFSFDAWGKRLLGAFRVQFGNVHWFDSLHKIDEATFHHLSLYLAAAIEYLAFSSKLNGVLRRAGLLLWKLRRGAIAFRCGWRRRVLFVLEISLALEFH